MTLEEKIVSKLHARNQTLTTAESCTGGLIAKRVTDISGCSDVFFGGCVTYTNDVKQRLIGVSAETLEKYGAVSEQTARAMAEGIVRVSGADLGVGITGIAGPGGGTPEKPVGLVYVGCYYHGEVTVGECRFTGDREQNRNAAVTASLELLWKTLSNY